jgi:selenide,water dikinase
MSEQLESKVKLTSLSSKGGCGCKIGPGELMGVLKAMPQTVRGA